MNNLCSEFEEYAEEWKSVVKEHFPYADIMERCEDKEGSLVTDLYPTSRWEPEIGKTPAHPSSLELTCNEYSCHIGGDIIFPTYSELDASRLIRSVPHCLLGTKHSHVIENHFHPLCVVSWHEVADTLDQLIRVAKIAYEEWGI